MKTGADAGLAARLRQFFSLAPYLPRAFRLVWNAAPGLTVAWLALLAVQGLLPAAVVALSRVLVNGLVQAVGGWPDWEAVRPAALAAGGMAGLMLLGELVRGGTTWIRTAFEDRVQDQITGMVHRQSVRLDLAFYDSPDYYDHLHRARLDASYRPTALVDSLGGLLQNGLTLAAMAAILAPYGAWLPAVLVISAAPALYVVLAYALRQHRWRLEKTADERRAWYYDWVMTTRETAAELRLFGLGGFFEGRFQEVRRRLREGHLALARDQSLARLGASLVALVITGAVMAWMGWRVLQGLATLGDLALFYQAFNQGQGLMRTLLENFGQLYSNSLFISDLFEFLEMEPEVVDPPHPQPLPQPVQGRLEFQHVTFCYPGGARTALDDFSLEIPAGQIAAIVGENGAGKSTLIKLLCRLYDPQAGCVKLDGVDLKDLPLEALWRSFTLLLQEPVHYQASVDENIAMGDLAAGADPAAVTAAAQAAGAEDLVRKLPEGYATLLGKWFDNGTELSVGEWQRLALARAFLRRAPVLVLDEPTSAMDPWAEADWLKRFRSLAQGRTAILITHRFTTAAHADRIYVMQAGRIVEAGRHADLLKLGGRYAESWRNQVEHWLREGG